MTRDSRRCYPKRVSCDGEEFDLRYMEPADRDAVLAFARGLPTRDLLFLDRNIAEPKVVTAWVRAVEQGAIASLLALRADAVVGCATVVCDDFASWSLHVGELRLLVDPEMRGQGLGRLLAQECFVLALGMGLEKLTARMPVDQHAAISTFRSLGFALEGVLRAHGKDRDGTKHDIAILSHDVVGFGARMEAYGLTEAF